MMRFKTVDNSKNNGKDSFIITPFSEMQVNNKIVGDSSDPSFSDKMHNYVHKYTNECIWI